jgi:hypothetical protein
MTGVMQGSFPEPAWLRLALDIRLAAILAVAGGVGPFREFGFVMTTLTEPDEEASDEERERWERTCDHCGRYFSDEEEFYTGHASRIVEDVQILIAFGVCPECRVLI